MSETKLHFCGKYEIVRIRKQNFVTFQQLARGALSRKLTTKFNEKLQNIKKKKKKRFFPQKIICFNTHFAASVCQLPRIIFFIFTSRRNIGRTHSISMQFRSFPVISKFLKVIQSLLHPVSSVSDTQQVMLHLYLGKTTYYKVKKSQNMPWARVYPKS